MDAIFLRDERYVLLDDVSNDKKSELGVDSQFVYSPQFNRNSVLYGGRVVILYDDDSLYIDGIKVIKFCANGMKFTVTSPNMVLITQYLNQIHENGIETFLSNYKVALEEFRESINAKKKEMESSNNNNVEIINNLDGILSEILCVQYDLMMHVKTNIAMCDMTNIYDSIANVYIE